MALQWVGRHAYQSDMIKSSITWMSLAAFDCNGATPGRSVKLYYVGSVMPATRPRLGLDCG